MKESQARLRALPLIAAAATGIQVGAAIVATRFVTAEISPASLAFLRYGIGALCLLPAFLAGPRVDIKRADLAAISLLGVAQFGLLIALLNYGLRTVPAARGALVFSLFPMLTLALAALAGHERLSAAKSAGIALTIVGVGFALGEKSVGGEANWLGEAAIFFSAFTGAACAILYRPYLRRYPALPVSFLAMLAAVGALAVPAAASDLFAVLPALGGTAWLAILFIGISSGAGYVLWLYALERIEASRVTIFLALSPLTASALGALLLAEPVSSTIVVGIGCIAAGLALATFAKPASTN